MQPLSDIDFFLRRLRRRVRFAESALLLARFAATAALAALALLALTPLAESSQGPQLAALLATSAWLAALAWSWWRIRPRWRDASRLVALLGPDRQALRSDLLSTVQLAAAPPTGSSPALVAALARQTATQLRELPALSVLAPRRWHPPALLGILGALAWAGAVAWQPSYWLPAARQLVDAVRAAPELAREPLVGLVAIEYQYPSYMARPSVSVPNSTGDITAPPGARVLLRATSTLPVSHANVVFAPSDGAPLRRAALTVGNHRALAGVITIADAGNYHFELLTGGARAQRDPVERRIEIEADLGPKIALRGPPDGHRVGSRELVELGFAAEDDWGLAELRLVYQVGSQPPATRVVWRAPVQREASRYAVGTHRWDLGELELAGAAAIRYWIEAVDNDAIHGPKSAPSSVQRLTIFSPDQQHAQTLAQQRQLTEQSLQLLAAHLVPPGSAQQLPSTGGSPLTGSHLTMLLAAQRRWVATVGAFHQQLQRDALIPAALRHSIRALLRRWQTLLETASAGRGALPSYLRRSTAALEQDTLLLADLLDEQRLQALALAARALQADRARLAALLARWREAPSAALRARIGREIARLQQHAAELASTQAQLQRTLPDEYLNHRAIDRLALAKDLGQLRRLFDTQQHDALVALLAELDGKLDALQRLVATDVEALRAARLDERERAWHATFGQLDQLSAGQQRLSDRTAALVRSYRQRGARLLEDRLAGLALRQQARAEQLRQHLRGAAPQRLASFHRERLERTLRWAGWLRERLAERDLDQAAQLAHRLAEDLDQAGADLREDTLGDYVPAWREPQDRAISHVDHALGLAQQIAQDLDQALPRPASLLQPGERRELQQLAPRQRGLAKQAGELERPRELGVAGDLLGPQGRELLASARRLMRDAAQQLAALAPQQALGAQQRALQQLAELRQRLDQARQPGPAPGSAQERERVTIPGAEAFTPPAALRRELLDAMQEPPPSNYSQQIKQYYRELVR